MRFRRLTTHEDAMYLPAMELYQTSFPVHEQREAAAQIGIMGHEEYRFYLMEEDDQWVGILLCWETAEFVYVEHFCTLPQMRGRGYGARALELLGCAGKTIVLEIDPPVDEVSLRRKGFYERAGYRANVFAHVHPPYRRGVEGHRLVVLSHSAPLTQGEYDGFYHYLKQVVMKP